LREVGAARDRLGVGGGVLPMIDQLDQRAALVRRGAQEDRAVDAPVADVQEVAVVGALDADVVREPDVVDDERASDAALLEALILIHVFGELLEDRVVGQAVEVDDLRQALLEVGRVAGAEDVVEQAVNATQHAAVLAAPGQLALGEAARQAVGARQLLIDLIAGLLGQELADIVEEFVVGLSVGTLVRFGHGGPPIAIAIRSDQPRRACSTFSTASMNASVSLRSSRTASGSSSASTAGSYRPVATATTPALACRAAAMSRGVSPISTVWRAS